MNAEDPDITHFLELAREGRSISAPSDAQRAHRLARLANHILIEEMREGLDNSAIRGICKIITGAGAGEFLVAKGLLAIA